MHRKLTIIARGRKHRPSGLFLGGIYTPDISGHSLFVTAVPSSWGERESQIPVDFPNRLKIQVTQVVGTQPPGDPLVAFGACVPKFLSQVRVIGTGETLLLGRVRGVSLHLDLGSISDFDVVGEPIFHKDFPVSPEAILRQEGADTLTLYPCGGLLPQILDHKNAKSCS